MGRFGICTTPTDPLQGRASSSPAKAGAGPSKVLLCQIYMGSRTLETFGAEERHTAAADKSMIDGQNTERRAYTFTQCLTTSLLPRAPSGTTTKELHRIYQLEHTGATRLAGTPSTSKHPATWTQGDFHRHTEQEEQAQPDQYTRRTGSALLSGL